MNKTQRNYRKNFFTVIMNLIAVSGIFITLFTTCPITASAFEVNELEAFMDGVINSQLDEHDITGATLSVVKDGKVLLSRGYGYADLEKRKAVDPERTLFRPGSVSKLFTWTAVMQLVEQGKLDLNTDINNYLDFKIPDYIIDKRADEVRPITMKHLMTHTPGFEDVGEELFVLSVEEMSSLEKYLKKHLPDQVFPPGEVMAYSNYGAALAGYIVEKVSGQSFDDYVEEHIFAPLNMNYSTFRQPLPDNLAPHMTSAYKYVGGEYYEGDFEYIPAYPAGSMSTTAYDMASFMIAHLQKGRYGNQKILREETVEKMHKQQFTHHPQVPGMALGFIEDNFNGQRVITHGGGTTLFFTGLFLVPEHNLGLFVSYSGGTGMEAIKLFQAFMDYYFPEELNLIEENPGGVLARAEAYTGEYYPNRMNFSNFEKLLGIFQSIQVKADKDGFLVVNFLGSDYQFAETGEGVYKNRNNNGTQFLKTIAFTNDLEDNILLTTGGPATYSKTPWYGSTSFLSLLTVLAILLMMGTLLGWTISFLLHWFRKNGRNSSLWPRAARFVVIVFALITIVFFIGLINIFTNINPAYGVPDIFFNIYNASLFNLLLSLPYFMAVLTGVMMVFAVFAWWKKYWTVGSRLHYSVITVMALGLMWVMIYVKLL